MRWLSIQWEDSNCRVAIQLPCPSSDLIALIGASSDPAKISGLLRRNPTLLIFALSKYWSHHQRAPSKSSPLIVWASDHLVRLLLREKPAVSAGKFRKIEITDGLKQFFRARSNKKLRQSISKFIGGFIQSEFKKDDRKRMVNRFVGKQLRADEFKSKRIRHEATLKNSIKLWCQSSNEIEFDLMGLFELAVSNAEFQHQFDRRLSEEKLASMKQLAYGASHEINNPLANIATRAQTMLATEDAPEKRNKLAVIYEQAIRAHEMISDMMLFAHPPALKKETVSLRLLISKLVNELKPVLDASPQIEFGVLVGSGVDEATLDATQVSVAIKSLIQNSLEAIHSSDQQRGRISVRIGQAQTLSSENQAGENALRAIEFSVCDNGQGISDVVRRHLFDPFFSGREAGRGLGFGLSKVWTIAKLHGGDVKFDSSDKDGTRFVLRIPLEGAGTSNASDCELVISNVQSEVEDEAA